MEHFQSDETRQDKTRQDSDSEDLAIWRSDDLAMSCLVLSRPVSSDWKCSLRQILIEGPDFIIYSE